MAKTKKVPGAKGDDAEQIILDYLRKQNRPYSANDISSNLHNAVTKTAAQKTLTSLVGQDEVTCKTYGKQMVYVVKQDQFESPSSEELAKMDEQIESFKKEISEYKEKNKQIQTQLNDLNASLTNDQIETQLKVLAEEIKKYEERLKLLKSGTRQISPEEKNAIDAIYDRNRKLWRVRKRLSKDIISLISENMEKKPADFMEDLGLENDPIDYSVDPLANI
ncbi:hypothetical protein G9A89_012001 [Geosiphon pyriformis]|nr:hypothetical protein G9A89_012001 [Geosiphon pyriformis]